MSNISNEIKQEVKKKLNKHLLVSILTIVAISICLQFGINKYEPFSNGSFLYTTESTWFWANLLVCLIDVAIIGPAYIITNVITLKWTIYLRQDNNISKFFGATSIINAVLLFGILIAPKIHNSIPLIIVILWYILMIVTLSKNNQIKKELASNKRKITNSLVKTNLEAMSNKWNTKEPSIKEKTESKTEDDYEDEF